VHRVLVFSALAIGLALAAPSLLSEISGVEKRGQVVAGHVEVQPAARRTVRLDADRSGHYLADFRINGRKVRGLIDTGASAIAISRTTAKELGLRVSASDFGHLVQTANGTIAVAPVMLKRIELGPIRVQNVRAIVIDDDRLAHTLIGMSFLNRLRSFRVENNRLVLDL